MKSSSLGTRQIASSERLMRRDDRCDASTALDLGLRVEHGSLRANEAPDAGNDRVLELPVDVFVPFDQARAELYALKTLDRASAIECCTRVAGWFVREFAPFFLGRCGEDEFASALKHHSLVDEPSSLDRAAAICSSMTYLVDGALERAFHFAFEALGVLSRIRDGEQKAVSEIAEFRRLMLDAIEAGLAAIVRSTSSAVAS